MTINEAIEALDRYRDYRQPLGHYLMAVLRNDLFEAALRADVESWSRIKEILGYCYAKLPVECWGSEERVKAWLANAVGA